MKTINISFSIDLEDDELAAVLDALGCVQTKLEDTLPGYANSALREYLDMIAGRSVITTASDLRERRLVGLILTALNGNMPDANWVGRVFNVSPTSARSLLRAVTSKHRRRLETAVKSETQRFLAACRHEKDGAWTVLWRNPVLIEVLNGRLENSGERKERIRRADDLGAFTVPNGSYEWLKANP